MIDVSVPIQQDLHHFVPSIEGRDCQRRVLYRRLPVQNYMQNSTINLFTPVNPGAIHSVSTAFDLTYTSAAGADCPCGLSNSIWMASTVLPSRFRHVCPVNADIVSRVCPCATFASSQV